MSFDPLPKQELSIDGNVYEFAEHPVAPGIAYGQEGRAAIVYKLEMAGQAHALKVFKPRFRLPTLVPLASRLVHYAALPGLTVCRRVMLTPQRHSSLLRENPELTYSVLMPWIDGPTWLQIVQSQQDISQEQSLLLARSLAGILAELEQQGIAHCDLSAANVIFPSLAEKTSLNHNAPVELVDVEQLYAATLERPVAIPSGSEGYAHLTVRQGIWEPNADRYAGAVLIAEILGWSNRQIRDAAWGESYFAPQDMQHSCPRFDLLRDSLNNHWCRALAQLFSSAWESELLADCPTFGEWLVAIPESVPSKVSVHLPDIEEVILITEKSVDEEQETISPDSTKTETTFSNTNKKSGEEFLSCPFCSKMIPVDVSVCPFCENIPSSQNPVLLLRNDNVKQELVNIDNSRDQDHSSGWGVIMLIMAVIGVIIIIAFTQMFH